LRKGEKTKKIYKTDDECLKKLKVKNCSFLVPHVLNRKENMKLEKIEHQCWQEYDRKKELE
jgi:hypothetical protein